MCGMILKIDNHSIKMRPDQSKSINYFLCYNSLNSTEWELHKFHFINNMGMASCCGLVDGWSCPVLREYTSQEK